MLDFFAPLGIIIPVLDTQRISVTVAHRTLTPFAGVRIPHPLPEKDHTSRCGLFLHSERDSKGRHQCAHWCNQVSGGHLVSPWENPQTCERIRYGCGHKSVLVAEAKKSAAANVFCRGEGFERAAPVFVIIFCLSLCFKLRTAPQNAFSRGEGAPEGGGCGMRAKS